MQLIFSELSSEQLDGLAKLCFDMAKVSFAFAFFPAIDVKSGIIQMLSRIFISALTGIAFTYGALLLLKRKEEEKQ